MFCALLCTCACHPEWKLSMVCDPEALPGYVPMIPDQKPANHRASGFQLPRVHRNCFPKPCAFASRKYVSCRYVTAWFDIFSSHAKVKCQMMSNNCAVGKIRLIWVIDKSWMFQQHKMQHRSRSLCRPNRTDRKRRKSKNRTETMNTIPS